MIKSLSRFPRVSALIAWLLAAYLKFVQRTTRFMIGPRDVADRVTPTVPFIAAIWHGQNFMLPLTMWDGAPVSVLITRHGDGDIVARACEMMGMRSIRASGGGKRKIEAQGGASGLRAMLSALDDGQIVVLTPDAPKIPRVAGPGILVLARLSGRPIVPFVVATTHRIDLNNWDRTSLCLPFGRGVILSGDPIYVSRDADEATVEAARRALEDSLNDIHARAYAMLGTHDPGAVLIPARS